MKPCIQCGAALSNNAVNCEECLTDQSKKDEASNLINPGKEDEQAETSESGWVPVLILFLDVILSTVIYGLVFVPICFGVMFLFSSFKDAMIGGIVMGIMFAASWTIFEMSVDSSFRGPTN